MSRFLDPPCRQIGEFRPDDVEQFERLDPLFGERCALVEGLDALSRQPDGFGQVGWSAYERQIESLPHPGIASAGQLVGLDDPVGPHIVGVDGLARLRHHADEVAEGLRLPLPVGRVGPPHQHPQQMKLPGVERGAFGSRADAFQPATDGSFVDGSIFFAVLHEPPPGGLGSKHPDIDIPADSRRLRGLVAGLVARLVYCDEAFDCRHPTQHIVIFSFEQRVVPPVGQPDAGQQPRARNERQTEFCLHPLDGRIDVDLLVKIRRSCRAEFLRPQEHMQIRRPEQRPLANGRGPQPISRPPAVGQPRVFVDVGIAPQLDRRHAGSRPRQSGVGVSVGRRCGQDGSLSFAEHRPRPVVDAKGEVGGQLLELHASVGVAPGPGIGSAAHATHELQHSAARTLCGAGVGILPRGCRHHHPDALQ